MTHTSAVVPSLPLSVSCAADARFAATLTALAHRVAAGTDDGAVADRFTSANTAGVVACLEHLGGDRSRLLSVELTAGPADVQGRLTWPQQLDEDQAFVARLEATLAGVADRVECGHRGPDVFCSVTCQRR
jgi:hypothetical protein